MHRSERTALRTTFSVKYSLRTPLREPLWSGEESNFFINSVSLSLISGWPQYFSINILITSSHFRCYLWYLWLPFVFYLWPVKPLSCQLSLPVANLATGRVLENRFVASDFSVWASKFELAIRTCRSNRSSLRFKLSTSTYRSNWWRISSWKSQSVTDFTKLEIRLFALFLISLI